MISNYYEKSALFSSLFFTIKTARISLIAQTALSTDFESVYDETKRVSQNSKMSSRILAGTSYLL